MLDTTRARARDRAQEGVQRTKDSIRDEVGRMLVDLVEERFPEHASANRYRPNWTMFVVGTLLGFYLARRLIR